MSNILSELQPKAVFAFFEEICQIPHPSYHEEKLAAYLCDFARARGLSFRVDALHNVLIKKPATAGYEDAETVMLQGHTDMVAQKRADSEHDFLRDPLKLVIEDGWIRADGTTLGGDDGIAVAMMLAILDDDTLVHPALECLFTVQEEVGLCGAAGFDYSDIEASLLFNLDSEDEGVGTVSCAGGIRVDMKRPVSYEKKMTRYATVCVSGLKGGHSGAEIHMPRANAHRVVGSILSALSETVSFRLSSLLGGNMDNAIPRHCTAVIAYEAQDESALHQTLDMLCQTKQALLSHADAETGCITARYGAGEIPVMTAEDTRSVLGILCMSVNGIVTMCEDMPSLVESSCNMGILCSDDHAVNFGFLARASVEERKEEIRVLLAMCAKQFGASIEYSGSYPGWAYDKNSLAAARYCKVYKRLYGREPRIEAIHAGLECGLMKHAVPNIDPISIGPDMKDIHTPQERISIESVARVYETVCEMLKEK